MKKITALILVLLLSLTFVACGTPSTDGDGDGDNTGDGTFDVVMVTDLGGIDDGSFNQGTWEGIVRYCTENNISHSYLRPIDTTVDGYLASIEQAVNGMKAKIVLCPGFLFEPAIYQAQELYPDVKFVLIDGYPNNGDWDNIDYRTDANVYAIQFAEQETGFLAGYAAVMDGHRKLAFFGGMAVPAVMRFGYGFVEGAEYAAKELGLAKDEVEIKYWYSGDFDPSPSKLTTISGWYETGTEVIFSCGGTIVENAIAAAEAAEDRYIIGVDVDQAHMSDRILTSAMKNLGDVAYMQLDLFFKGEFQGGVNAVLGVEEGMVSLPDDFSRFNNFTKEQYDEIYAKLVADEDGIRSGLSDASIETPEELPLELVKLEYLND